MKRKRYSDEQIAFALRQADGGTAVEEICRKLGVSEATFYRCKKQFAGMGTVEIRRLKQLEEENAKLKRLVADLSLDKTMLQDVLRKKMVRPGVRRDVVGVLQGTYQISQRRACSAMGFGRLSHRYRSRRDPQVALRMRLKDLAAVRVRYGYRRPHVLLRREGWAVNHKKMHRLYTEEGLSIRTKLPRRKNDRGRVRAGRRFGARVSSWLRLLRGSGHKASIPRAALPRRGHHTLPHRPLHHCAPLQLGRTTRPSAPLQLRGRPVHAGRPFRYCASG